MLLSTNKRRFGKGFRKAVRRFKRRVTKAVNRAWKAATKTANDVYERSKKMTASQCGALRRRHDSRCRKKIAGMFRFFEKTIKGVAKIAYTAIRGVWNWLLNTFACFGIVRVMHGVGYGTAFTVVETYPKSGAAFSMSYSGGYAQNGIRHLFDLNQPFKGRPNIVFGLSLVIGLIPDLPDPKEVMGGVRAGVGFGGGLACDQRGCRLFLSVANVMSAMVIRGFGFIPWHPLCIFGPLFPWDAICFYPRPCTYEKVFPEKKNGCFKCFETVGVTVTVICCEFWLTKQKNNCR